MGHITEFLGLLGCLGAPDRYYSFYLVCLAEAMHQ